MSARADGFRVLTADLGGSALSRALRAREAPADWSSIVPADDRAWRARATATAAGHTGWLERLAPAFGTGAALLGPVAEGGVVITTGQQPGLFGGPIYTLAKALSALAMSEAHERATGVPTRPVFWAATDDADFAEAASIAVVGPRGLDTLTLSATEALDAVPLAFRALGHDVDALRARLAAACGSLADERVMRAAAAFRAGATVGAAYLALMRALLEPLGIAVLDAAHPAVGAATRPLMRAALAAAPGVQEALVARGAALSAAGFEPPVAVDRALSLVFAWEGSADAPRKRRLTIDEALAAGDPAQRLSPNVLLRPVMEAWMLPTVAYVAGPGELAYFSQVSAVADALALPRPLALPRWSGLIVPADVEDELASRGWSLEHLRDPHAAENAIAAAAVPAEIIAMFARLRTSVASELAALDAILPEPAVAGARSDLARRLDRIERRVRGVVKHRERALLQRIARVRAVVHPNGTPQERTLSFVPFVSRYGEALIAAQLQAARGHAERWWPVGP